MDAYRIAIMEKTDEAWLEIFSALQAVIVHLAATPPAQSLL